VFEPDALIVRADVHIVDISPPVGRTLELPMELNLAQLHEVLQAAFGWTDSHLHEFEIGGLSYGAPEFDEDGLSDRRTFEASEVRLADFAFRFDAPILIFTNTTSAHRRGRTSNPLAVSERLMISSVCASDSPSSPATPASKTSGSGEGWPIALRAAPSSARKISKSTVAAGFTSGSPRLESRSRCSTSQNQLPTNYARLARHLLKPME
jgi:hypothetical protein